jgi:hypothetical protein
VNTSDVADNAISGAKLKADSVTSGKIIAGSVTNSDLADFSVTGSKLKAGSVTHAKLEPEVQAMLTAPQLKFKGVAAIEQLAFDLATCESHPNYAVTIKVPGPGKGQGRCSGLALSTWPHGRFL